MGSLEVALIALPGTAKIISIFPKLDSSFLVIFIIQFLNKSKFSLHISPLLHNIVL